MYIKRRTFIRILSFSLIAVIALAGFGIYQFSAAKHFKQTIMHDYSRSFDDLSEHLYNIEAAFDKSQYAATPYQAVRLASEIWRETGAAKTALEGMPTYDWDLGDVSEFLAKAGDYAYYITSQILRGESMTEDETKNLADLAGTASTLANYIGNLRLLVADGAMNLEEEKFSVLGIYETPNDQNVATGEIVSVKEQISGYPELIYDGPFSDHIEKLAPVFLEGKSVVSADEAKERVAKWLNIKAEDISLVGEISSKIESYLFDAPDRAVQVTKLGGYLLSVSCAKTYETENLSVDQAITKAQELFSAMGISGMKESYYMRADGEITINFDKEQDGITDYPDIIKVCVSLEDGSICGYEAYGYMMAHKTRTDTHVVISETEAQKSVSSKLTVKKHGIAIIPTDGKNEVLCHEFVTQTADGRHIIVYVNAKTGVEEMLQILIETEDGTLTM